MLITNLSGLFVCYDFKPLSHSQVNQICFAHDLQVLENKKRRQRPCRQAVFSVDVADKETDGAMSAARKRGDNRPGLSKRRLA